MRTSKPSTATAHIRMENGDVRSASSPFEVGIKRLDRDLGPALTSLPVMGRGPVKRGLGSAWLPITSNLAEPCYRSVKNRFQFCALGGQEQVGKQVNLRLS